MAYVAQEQDPFRAIADANRRIMLDAMLREECTVGQLTDLLGVRQPTVSQHIRVLRLAGLVEERKVGRNVFYRAAPAELQVVDDWLAKYQAFWMSKLDSLGRYLARRKRSN
jgi:DNA-binding transcriptional ArsR family regulator